MKTAIIFDFIGGELKYFVVDGDQSHLDDLIVGSDDLTDAMVKEITNISEQEPVTKEVLRQAIVDGAKLIELGWIM